MPKMKTSAKRRNSNTASKAPLLKIQDLLHNLDAELARLSTPLPDNRFENLRLQIQKNLNQQQSSNPSSSTSTQQNQQNSANTQNQQNNHHHHHHPNQNQNASTKNAAHSSGNQSPATSTKSTHNTNNQSNNQNSQNKLPLQKLRPATINMMSAGLNTSHLGSTQGRSVANLYRSRVVDAYRHRRIFTIFGNYNTIRRSLLRRGWLEKLAPGRYPKLMGMTEDMLVMNAKRGNDFEAALVSKIINHFPAFFVWQGKSMRDIYADALPYRNRVRRSRNLDFSTKVGLIGCAQQELWHHQDGVSSMTYPRFYCLGGTAEERSAFIDDFRFTQCRSLITFLIEKINEPSSIINEDEGTIPVSILEFAVNHIEKQLRDWENSDLDKALEQVVDMEAEWLLFMARAKSITQQKAKFRAELLLVKQYSAYGQQLMEKVDEKEPNYKWDGYHNLWILKPGYQCRGMGIIIRSTLNDILAWANNNTGRRYIVQKYIERPLLIYKTKFDIRQYMLLVLSQSTVSIWLYKDCYLRFSTQEFSIDDLRESIHLTNNSVQKKYKNKPNRDARLPKNNMWCLDQFLAYLRTIKAPADVWNEKVYKGFKQNLISVVLASLEETEFIENAFELYGCDFMLDETFNPILLEINSTPDLSPSTEVTSRLCPIALKDLVKVVVDVPQNSRAPTGRFEKIYELNYRVQRDYSLRGVLDVAGHAMSILRQPISTKTSMSFWKRKPKVEKKTISTSGAPSTAMTATTSHAAAAAKPSVPIKKFNERPEKMKVQVIVTKPLQPQKREVLALQYTRPK